MPSTEAFDFDDAGVLSNPSRHGKCTVCRHSKSTEAVVCKVYFVTVFLIILQYPRLSFFAGETGRNLFVRISE